MRAIWYADQGAARDVLTLGEMDEPQPGPGEVAVYVKASGVNPSDVKQRAGARGPMTVARQIPHSDGAGVIKAVGEGVDPSRIGERVWLFNAAFKRAHGTCAEVCVLPAECAARLADETAFEAGACLGVPAITAHRALFCDGPITGKTVLVTGGAGAVGLMAIQLAKWGGAAQVIATISSAEKAQAALAAGADEVINYRRQDVVEAVEAATEGAGVDHVVEVEFGGNLKETLDVLKPNGVIASYGSEAERTPELPFYDLMFKNIRIETIFVYLIRAEHRAAAVHDINRALSEGGLKPVIHQIFDLAEAPAAHECVEAGGKIGAVLVRI
jgi:NADPH2:quinone reductase